MLRPFCTGAWNGAPPSTWGTAARRASQRRAGRGWRTPHRSRSLCGVPPPLNRSRDGDGACGRGGADHHRLRGPSPTSGGLAQDGSPVSAPEMCTSSAPILVDGPTGEGLEICGGLVDSRWTACKVPHLPADKGGFAALPPPAGGTRRLVAGGFRAGRSHLARRASNRKGALIAGSDRGRACCASSAARTMSHCRYGR